MHTYAQVLQQRFLDSGGSVEKWSNAVSSGQVGRIFEAAPSCKCGCGEKVFPSNLSQALCGKSAEFKYPAVKGHGRLILPSNYVFPPHQRQLIIASCFGDASLLRNKSAGPYSSSHRLAWNMGDKAHAEFKREAFSFLGARLTEKVNPGWGAKWFSVRTCCHPGLDQFRDQFYGPDRRVIATPACLSELDGVGWAWWYGDDGSLIKESKCAQMALLHTEGYSEADNFKIKLALESFIGIEGGVSVAKYFGGTPKKERTMLRLKTNATVEFFKRIAPHMAPSMAYKLGDFHIA